jgi:hypothetical protein
VSNTARSSSIDAPRLWAGGAATAVVAALVALVGVLVSEGLLNIAMVRPPLISIGDSFGASYAITAAVLALVATALAHLLVVATPRPRSFFSWIVGLATVVGVVVPLALDGSLGGRLATAFTDFLIGVVILTLLRSVMTRTVRPPAPMPRPY